MMVRAPGRVNLIGDHTDYNGLPVFPMAIQKEIRVRFEPRKDRKVRLTSTGGFPPREFDISKKIPCEQAGDWSNYARAAAQALESRFGPLHGMNATVSGDIPEAAGLSSSSALVVGCALALLEANRSSCDVSELAKLLARGERYVGTQGGGMDQTVCLCATAGSALKISFTPFGHEAVAVPADWAFMVGHSLVVADKSLGARERFNATRARCEAAVRQYARLTGMPASYPQLLNYCSGGELAAIAESLWPEETPELLCAFRHVVSEGVRVERAVEAMRTGDRGEFGRAMVESHVSLRDDLAVSCAALDELVDAFLAAGAAGARVTGAGFGGCVVALCPRGETAGILEEVERRFYDSRHPRRAGFSSYLFPVEPSRGAGLGE